MINFDDVTRDNLKAHNANRPKIPDYTHQILAIGSSGLGKTNVLLNLMNHQPGIVEIYLYAKDPYEAKYQVLINKPVNVGSSYCNDPKAFIKYSNDMDDIYESIDEYNSNEKLRILVIFNVIITDMLSNKKLNPIVIERFIRGRKLSISKINRQLLHFY